MEVNRVEGTVVRHFTGGTERGIMVVEGRRGKKRQGERRMVERGSSHSQ